MYNYKNDLYPTFIFGRNHPEMIMKRPNFIQRIINKIKLEFLLLQIRLGIGGNVKPYCSSTPEELKKLMKDLNE